MAVNTHLDHKGQQARKEGARLLLTKVNELAPGLPVVMTGDFNAEMKDIPYLESCIWPGMNMAQFRTYSHGETLFYRQSLYRRSCHCQQLWCPCRGGR